MEVFPLRQGPSERHFADFLEKLSRIVFFNHQFDWIVSRETGNDYQDVRVYYLLE